MMIDVDKILKDKDAKDKIRPKIGIRILQGISIPAGVVRNPAEPDRRAPVREIPHTEGRQLKGDVAGELEMEMRNLRIARARLSNKYPEMVRSGASAFALAANHAEIESYTAQMQDVYLKQRHVERYGRLPDPEPAQVSVIDSGDMIKLKKHLRSLVDKRCKLQVKLLPSAKEPKNPDRMTQWALELDQVNVEYRKVKEKIRALKPDYEG